MQSDVAKYLFQTAISHLRKGDLSNASDLSQQLLKVEPASAYALMLAGLIARDEGNFKDSQDFLERAKAAAPRDAMILGNLANLYRLRGKLAEATSCYRETAAIMHQAVKSNPENVHMRVEYAAVLEFLSHLEAAAVQLRVALELDSEHSPAWLALARTLERSNLLDEASTAAKRALKSLDPEVSGPAGMLCARISLRQKDPNSALAYISAVRSMSVLPMSLDGELAGIEGEALDAMGRYDEAYKAFVHAGERFRSVFGAHFVAAKSPLDIDFLQAVAHAQPAPSPVIQRRHAERVPYTEHIFLAGFPRSGTTLLGQILGAHSQVMTLDETDASSSVVEAFWRSGDPNSFYRSLDTTTAEALRDEYWARVRTHIGAAPARRVLIDKMPLNSAFFELLGAVFPAAKFIFVMRDPRDACLSCFQQSFEPNAANLHFWDLDSTVTLYGSIMGAADAALKSLGARALNVRYENVIEDFEAHAKRALSFMGLEYSGEIADYRGAVASQAVSTPSARQVVEPIHHQSIGKWRRYAPFAGESFDRLLPWVERFGY